MASLPCPLLQEGASHQLCSEDAGRTGRKPGEGRWGGCCGGGPCGGNVQDFIVTPPSVSTSLITFFIILSSLKWLTLQKVVRPQEIIEPFKSSS